jgi:hypothetical protein
MMREVGVAGRGNRKIMGIYLGNLSQKKIFFIRIGFQNIGGFPVDKGKYKDGNIRKEITKWEFDIFR